MKTKPIGKLNVMTIRNCGYKRKPKTERQKNKQTNKQTNEVTKHNQLTINIPDNTQTKIKISPYNQSGTSIRHSEDQPIGMHHSKLGSSTC